MAVTKPDKKMRQMDGRDTTDPSNINNLTYNEASGGFKNLNIGPFLKPIRTGTNSYTTDATTARSVRKGSIIAIYNNSGTLGAITCGDSASMTALAAGATDTNGNVGIPCPPNTWTYIATNDKQFIRTTAATLLTFIIEDETYITSQKQG
jgi:hypothetical protein